MTPRPASQTRKRRQSLPPWVVEGAAIRDPVEGKTGIVQFVGEWEDPATRLLTENAVFARTVGGGREWIVQNPSGLQRG
ncbi:hypothetical protein [Streptomyces sp. NPDC089799]|uniref:hypothetical protein n=1 Tax=Streptomyces sp. NPDC089799 TaxID=3155066 RepID=UPI003436F44D